MTPAPSFNSVLTTDFWVHVAGLISIAVGLGGDKYLGLGLGPTADLMFIIGGFAAMGLKLTNGTVAAVSAAAAQAVRDTAVQTANQLQAQAVAPAAAAAAVVTTTATHTAADLAAGVSPVSPPAPVAPVPLPTVQPPTGVQP
jgi:hypothetical protein